MEIKDEQIVNKAILKAFGFKFERTTICEGLDYCFWVKDGLHIDLTLTDLLVSELKYLYKEESGKELEFEPK